MERCKVKFLPEDKEIEVIKGQTLLAAALSAGVYIYSSCGGEGVCGRCKVIVKEGSVRSEASGRISKEEREKGYCLACRSAVGSDCVIEIPPESRLDLDKISEEEAQFLRLKGLYSAAEEIEVFVPKKEKVFVHSPLATKLYLNIPKPTLTDNISDLERLYREIRKKRDIPIMQTGLANLKKLGHLLRESDWNITVTLGKRNETTEIVLIEPGNTSKLNFGVAFDIGTTTVCAQLVDLNTKAVLGTKATYNMQAAFGSDVITRIIFAGEKDGLERLHHAVIDNMNSLIQELVRENRISLNNVNGVMCAGNTTMTHLLLRVDPTFIRREPYTPTANFVPVIRAAEAGIKINPRGLLACVPGVSTYVGGDITAGVLACGLSDEKKLSMLIDVGTNGEIVLGNNEWMVSCAASAGPAFEGSGVSCGMRAAKGAIQRVKIDKKGDSVKLETIGGERPKGICGSGMIDALSEMFKNSIIDRNGKINTSLKTKRIRKSEAEQEFVLAFAKDTQIDRDIVLAEADIENLKRSKGAIYAASSILLRKLELNFKNINKFYIAGGFGNYLDVDNAVTIGLLPDLPRERFKFVGNTSLRGSRHILLSYDTMKKAEEIARKITYFELSTEPNYMEEYVSALFFPHTNLERFPSAKEYVKK